MSKLTDYAGEHEWSRRHWLLGEAALLVSGVWARGEEGLACCVDAADRIWELPDPIGAWADLGGFQAALSEVRLSLSDEAQILNAFARMNVDISREWLHVEPVPSCELDGRACEHPGLNRRDVIAWACVLGWKLSKSLLLVDLGVDDFGESAQRGSWADANVWTATESAKLLVGEWPEEMKMYDSTADAWTVFSVRDVPPAWHNFLSKNARDAYDRLQNAVKDRRLKPLRGSDGFRPRDVVQWARELWGVFEIPDHLKGLATGPDPRRALDAGRRVIDGGRKGGKLSSPIHDPEQIIGLYSHLLESKPVNEARQATIERLGVSESTFWRALRGDRSRRGK